MHIRELRPVESMRLYTGHFSSTKHAVLHRIFASSDKRIVFSAELPVKSTTALCDVLATNTNSLLLHYINSISTNTVACMLAQTLPSTDDWIEAYQKNHDTHMF